MNGARGRWTAVLLLGMAAGEGIAQNRTDGKAVGDQTDGLAESWSRLEQSFHSKKADERVRALSALSLLGGNRRAEAMVRDAINDSEADIDVRIAGIVAAGQMDSEHPHTPAFHTQLRSLLESPDPKLSFTAASALWAMHDAAGQDILMATAEGERASDYSFWKRSTHNASRTLHSPEALAKIAVQQSLVILVPPVGMGMGAYGYLKGTPGTSPQVTAIVSLGRVHSPEVRKTLIEATRTRDDGARIAAAEALASYTGPEVRDALYDLILVEKSQVRLTASAAYIRSSDMPGTRPTSVAVKPVPR